jgi:D-alanyl-lipoteichoic acid acyltransferase DltB (MBOAT superfamily)
MRGSSKIQNLWLLAASYVFYGYADLRMVILLLIATITFYVLGLAINRVSSFRFQDSGKSLLTPKTFVVLGVILGAGMLLYFKYLNFFIEQFAALFGVFGLKTNFSSFNIIVPIGISFFTFKLIAYVVEVYKGNMEPCKDFVTFATYIAFFPTIMSGPIDAPKLLIPQMANARNWQNDKVAEGLKRVLWGMFMKMCIADKVSGYTDAVFNNAYHHNATSIIAASVLYTFQIYADFSGYSEMAIGTSQIMGFRVTENFMRPYFSQNVGDFWRRWHASLMNWFRDYIYFPLGGSRCSKTRMYWNTMVVFMVSGLWHGANWTFIFWGAYHGLLVCFYKLTNKKKNRVLNTKNTEDNTYKKKLETWNLKLETVRKYANILLVFILVTIGWQVFRCNSFGQFVGLWERMFTGFGPIFKSWALMGFIPIGILMFKEMKDEEGWNIHLLHSKKLWVQIVSFALIAVFILYFGELEGGSFIYFQF